MRYDAGAAAYDRLTGRWSRLYAHAALDAAGVKAGDCVLDLATGTGDTALLASARLGALGTVVGVDLSLPMLLVAGAKSSGVRMELVAADAQALPFRARTFDAALCQFGLMFFPDRVARPAGSAASPASQRARGAHRLGAVAPCTLSWNRRRGTEQGNARGSRRAPSAIRVGRSA